MREPSRSSPGAERRGLGIAAAGGGSLPRPCPSSLQCEAVQFDMSWKVPAILYYARRNLNSKYNLVSECLSGAGCGDKLCAPS